MDNVKNIFEGIILLSLLVFAGTVGIAYYEHIPLIEAFYWTMLTITTVSSKTVTFEGKMFSIGLLVVGMGTVLYVATNITKTFIEGQARFFITGLKGGFSKMKKIKNHIVVCGHGRIGKYVCDTLKKQKKQYIIIEQDTEKAKHLLEKGENIINGDAMDQHVLEKANIMKAKSLIATLSEDADNLYLLMNASEINPNLVLAGKAIEEEAVKRMHKVGAQIVVMPSVVGGKQLAEAVLEVEKVDEESTVSEKKK